jgi:NADH oxidase (H2O-forming)
MSDAIKIKKNLYYIGVSDKDIRVFDIIMKTANGTTYNSYLLKTDEGIVIFDTVKVEFQELFFKKIESIAKYKDIKYIIMHHLEPDHSGALAELKKRSPKAKVLISPMAQPMLKSIAKASDIEFETVWTNKILHVGSKSIKFLSTPNLHWPETMSSYIQEDGILFSGDVFGSHYYDSRLFDDLVGDFDYAFQYYYDHIMRPFKSDVLNALKLYDSLEKIDTICNLHGPIIRDNPSKYIELYRTWSNKSVKLHGKKIVSIFYVTSYKNTQDLAQSIYDGVESNEKLIANIYDLSALDEQNMINILEESSGILIGAPTINADAPKPVWDLLSCMMLIEKKGKFGGCFGSYGWSGEAVEMIQHRLKLLKFRVPLEPQKVKLIPTKSELMDAYEFGVEFGEIVNGKMVEITL